MIPFQYSRISKAFIEELVDRVQLGESLVLLGPRYGGKRHVMFRIRAVLEAAEITPVVQLRFLAESPVATAQQALRLISTAINELEPGLSIIEESNVDLFGPIDQLHVKTQRPVILFAANLDSLAHHLARRFLQGVRTRVNSGQMVVILSGEDDLRDLVYGPKSEFACANQFVLQGYARDEFEDYLERYARHLGFRFDSFRDATDRIWTLTGGNTYTIRLVLWDILETRARADTPPSEPIKASDIRGSLKMVGIPGIYGSHVFRHSTELIANDPDCWEELEVLIKGESVLVGIQEYAPSRLELAGLVCREATREGGELRFSSPLMEQFVSHYYDDRRFGDLYAAIGRWDEAFDRYIRLDQEARMRPSGANDRGEVEATVSALCASLYSEATKDIASVKKLFEQGCHYVLGFPEVSFWHHTIQERPGDWELQDPDVVDLPEEAVSNISRLLGLGANLSPGPLPVSDSLDKYCVAAILPALRSDQRVAVVVSDLKRRAVISRERERLLKQLVHHFVEAYSHAVLVDGLQVRIRVRNKHMEIMNSILESWGRSVLDVQHVLKMAARGLRQLEYRRVLFCLVDPERRWIRGVLDDSDDPNVDVAEMTNWRLDEPKADIQPYVISTGQPKIVEDASADPLANKAVVHLARMKSEAVVPILNPSDEAIGTIHVERADDLVPSNDEVADLMAFGRQLAVAIEQSERVNLLESALDEMPEPIVIIDRTERPRYANQPGAELFAVKAGWLDRESAPSLSGGGSETILELIRQSFNSERRVVRHLMGIGSKPGYQGAALASVIRDRRETIIGGLIHIQDLNYLYRVIEAFRVIAEAKDTTSAISSVLDAAMLLRPKWGRLYLVDQNSPDRLVGKLSFGFLDPADEEEFNRGEVILPSRRESGHEHWVCIDKKEPVVFCWRPDLIEGAPVLTSFGLKAINVNPEKSPGSIKKSPGDFWIDFPLVTQDRVLGKVCLQCDENLRPEDFELLKVLATMAAGLLDAALRRDRGFRRAMAEMAHNIHTRLAGLPWILRRYEGRASEFVGLKAINDDFSRVVEETTMMTQRAKERLGPIIPNLSTLDVVGHIEHSLGAHLPEKAWRINSTERPLLAEADRRMFEEVILELVENSREMVKNPDDLFIDVSIELSREGSRDWIRITYKDKGPGIPAPLREKIFEDFFSRRPERKIGLGLGLSYARRVIESHNGHITAEPSDEGAQFLISIPASSIEP